MGDITYKSFCWVIGTTSFRTAKLNLKIEEQLILLDEFISGYNEWSWDNSTQEEFYNFMQSKGFLIGDAARKDKDARQKTSGLVDIGLLSENRTITKAGLELLRVIKTNKYNSSDNLFNISEDSFIYLKQLLKTSLNIDGSIVRPFLVVLSAIAELGSLTYEEFKYLIPLIKDKQSYEKIINHIKTKRELNIEDIIYECMISMDNYKKAYELLMHSRISKELIYNISINRKSKKYDEIYYELYLLLIENFLFKNQKLEELLCVLKRISGKASGLWKRLIFQTTNIQKLRKDKNDCINTDCPFLTCKDEIELKKIFFKYLHVFKAMATLDDYFDLNRRYFNLSNIIIFEHENIRLDVLPYYYFKEGVKEIKKDMFIINNDLQNNILLNDISEVFKYKINKIYEKINKDYNINIKNAKDAQEYINKEKLNRFNSMIDKKFDNKTLVKLLEYFEKRNDKEIEKLVTDEANIPTIFEYIIGVIWYKISDRKGDILDYMKLSLDANLLPKTHAVGGYADNVYRYDRTNEYPKHSVLIEMTLAEKTNQRKMEMEPVSRHLGDYLIKYGNDLDYTVFVSTYLDVNVISDFRFRSIMPYVKDGNVVNGMKIIPLDTDIIKQILKKDLKYSRLYSLFDKYHKEDIRKHELPIHWHQSMIEELMVL